MHMLYAYYCSCEKNVHINVYNIEIFGCLKILILNVSQLAAEVLLYACRYGALL